MISKLVDLSYFSYLKTCKPLKLQKRLQLLPHTPSLLTANPPSSLQEIRGILLFLDLQSPSSSPPAPGRLPSSLRMPATLVAALDGS